METEIGIETVVRCGEQTFFGVVRSTRVEWAQERGVLVSILVQLSDPFSARRIRFYLTVDDAAAWERTRRVSPVEADAMEVEHVG